MLKKKGILLIIFGVIIVVILSGVGIKTYLENNLNKLTDLTISEVDLTHIEDGSYSGSYKALPIVVEVKVTMKDHKITKIDLIKHINGQGSAAEVIPNNVIKNQTLQVDSISGATYSSKVILKAIQNALKSGIK